MSQEVDASPTKAFFIENLTRDLTLEDAILDLIDNSIDSAIQEAQLDVSAELLEKQPDQDFDKIPIEVEVSEERIVIRDWAGGIDPQRAVTTVFRLGTPPSKADSTLGVYGIGLKRAVFKMGRSISIRSWHDEGAFEVQISPAWMDDETNWRLPLKRIDSSRETGTEIVVENLHDDIKLRIRDPALLRRLIDAISETYCLFLEHLVRVQLNGSEVEAMEIPLGESDEVRSGKRLLSYDGVTAEILTGLQPRVGSRWEMEKAGWYVLCNGRVVVFADKTELTGWGAGAPQFTAKHRGFVGVAFFFSSDPSQLPWTTTKRGLNQESSVYQLARKEMAVAARPVLKFLNDMYPSDAPEEDVDERELADTVRVTPLHQLAGAEERSFTPAPVKEKKPKMTSIQFKVLKQDVDRARKCLGKPRWSNARVGEHAFEYFLEQECPE